MMMRSGIFPAIAFGLMLAVVSPARGENIAPVSAPGNASQKSGLKQVLDRLQKHYRDTNSFSAKFHEEVTTVGAPKRLRSGLVSFRKPGRMRWEFSAPEVQTIVSDGETLYSYDPELNQVVETPLEQALRSSSATSFLLGMGNINHDFKATFANSMAPDGLIQLILDAKAGGYKIQIGLDPKTYNLVTLTLTDQLGDVTKVDFTDIHNNVELPDSVFAFKAPAGADIVTAPSAP
jgi:outer membrane lipoprotein carrier protein